MAVELFEDLDQLQESISVNCSFSLAVIGSNMELAVKKYIIPWVGAALYDDLAGAVEDGDPLTSDQESLIKLLRRALAHFGLFLHMDEAAVQISDAGVLRREGNNMKTAYKYQENNLRDALIRKGWEWLEISLIHLDQNTGNYPLWSQDLIDRNRKLFINYSHEFNWIVNIPDGRYHLESFRGIMEGVENFAILPVIGQDYFTELKTQINTDTLTAENYTALTHIQKAVANFTKSEAIRKNLAQFRADGLVMIQRGTQEGKEWYRNPTANTANNVVLYNDADANRHIDFLLEILRADPDGYPTYNTFYEVQLEELEEDEADDCGSRGCQCTGICCCSGDPDEYIMMV